jgi:hypothetical protein
MKAQPLTFTARQREHFEHEFVDADLRAQYEASLERGLSSEEALDAMVGTIRIYWAQLIGAEFPSARLLRAELDDRVGLAGG